MSQDHPYSRPQTAERHITSNIEQNEPMNRPLQTADTVDEGAGVFSFELPPLPTAADMSGYGHNHIDEDGEEEHDTDVGMFSFRPPTQGSPGPAPSTGLPPPGTGYTTDQPKSRRRTGGPFNPFSFRPTSTRQTTATVHSDAGISAPPTARITTASQLSPAAAYALANQTSAAQSNGRTRRQSGHVSNGPAYVIGSPYTNGSLQDEEQHIDSSARENTPLTDVNLHRRSSDLSSKVASLNGRRYEDSRRSDSSSQIDLDHLDAIHLEELRRMQEEEEKAMEGLDDPDEDSPYPEVRASVSNIDDPDMPALTFRSWTLGLFFSIVVSGINAFFFFRYPAPYITPIIVQLISYPFGKSLAWLLPFNIWRVPNRLQPIFGDEFSFNPGPFNIKEHTIIVLMANVATAPVYALNLLTASEKFYGISYGAGFDFVVVFSTSMVGFGVAGLCRRFLVWPSHLIWPQNLVLCTLLNTLHAEDEDADQVGGTTRYRFFAYVFCGAFAWYFFPGFLFQGLSAFSFVCWAAPNNVVVNQLFGVVTGLGMSALTFDWAQISFLGSPLVIPWWASVNIFCGFVAAFWIIAPILYYTNVWNSAYLPISSSQIFDRFGAPYDITNVLTATGELNVTAYALYSPPYLPVTFAASYAVSFALATAAIVHTVIYHGRDIITQVKNVRNTKPDVHMKLMLRYPEVPDWWYGIYLLIFIGLSIVTVTVWDTQLPVWAMFVALFMGFVYVLPGGFIFAMSNLQIFINLVVQLAAGYLVPGKPRANMLFKTFAVQSVVASLSFIQDLKLGHYMKIPPRATFRVQIISTFISGVVQVGVKRWLFAHVPDLCDPHQRSSLICPNATVFYSSSVIWGLIGPARQFAEGQVYNVILWFLLIGAFLPVIFWFAARRWPKSFLRYVNIPILLTGVNYMPPANGINYSSWFLVGFIFQYFTRHRYFRWWSKFNFILSAALDSGTVLSALFIFLTLLLPKGGTLFVNWWGNDVFLKTLDYEGVPYKIAPPEGFGRTTW